MSHNVVFLLSDLADLENLLLSQEKMSKIEKKIISCTDSNSVNTCMSTCVNKRDISAM